MNSKTRKPQKIDIHVGKRIRMRRSLLGMSQEKLAEIVGLTFQQIQKYEQGTNRVSVSRLYQISQALDAPVSYFYKEFDEGDKKVKSLGFADNLQEDFEGDDILYSKETLELLRIYYSLIDDAKRKELIKIVRSMVENMK